MRIIKGFSLLLVLILLPVMLFASGDKEEGSSAIVSQDWIQVDENWNVNYEFKGSEIEFTLTAPTTGWVGIGFNPSSRMKDADFVVGYVKDGTLFVQDSYGVKSTSIDSDTSIGGTDNVRGISGTENNGITTIVFALPLDSNDIYDKTFVQGDSYKVLLAYGKDSDDNFDSKHRKRDSMDAVLK